MKKLKFTLLLAVLFLCSFHMSQAKDLVFGQITSASQPDAATVWFEKMSKYLSKHLDLNEFGYSGVSGKITNGMDEMVALIKNKEVDLVAESAVSTLILHDKAGTTPILDLWKSGLREYNTVFFTLKESPIQSIKDLNGKLIALEYGRSTSAFVMPMGELNAQGYKVALVKEGEEDSRPKQGIGYIKVGHSINQAHWVFQKKADFAAFGSHDWKDLPEGLRSKMRIFHEGPMVPRFIISAQSGLPKKAIDKINDAFVKMDQDDDGKAALKSFAKATKVEILTVKDLEQIEKIRPSLKFADTKD